MKQSQSVDNPPRRRWLAWAVGATWAMLATAAGLGLAMALRLVGGGQGQARPPAPVSFDAADWPAVGQARARGGVALARDEAGFFALRLKCPHLGCQPTWRADLGRFVCPCHGSSFAADGALLAGPAQRGLETLDVRRAASGALIVDPARPARPGQRLKA